MSFNYGKLKGRIIEMYGSQTSFAESLGVSTRTLSLKMNNRIYFTQDEIAKAARLLDIDMNDIKSYFFTQNV